MYLDRFNLKGRVAVVTGGGRASASPASRRSRRRARMSISLTAILGRPERRTQAMRTKGYATDVIGVDMTSSSEVDEAARRVMSERDESTSWSATPGACAPASPPKMWRMHAGLRSWTLMSIASSGAAAPSAGRCWRRGVDLSSISARWREIILNRPQPQASYNVSKAAVHHLTKSLAAEWGARGVRVNAVAPTYVSSPTRALARANRPMSETWIEGTPLGRIGEPDEIAAVVLFLASDAASLMTGSIVLADGGYTCW